MIAAYVRAEKRLFFSLPYILAPILLVLLESLLLQLRAHSLSMWINPVLDGPATVAKLHVKAFFHTTVQPLWLFKINE